MWSARDNQRQAGARTMVLPEAWPPLHASVPTIALARLARSIPTSIRMVPRSTRVAATRFPTRAPRGTRSPTCTRCCAPLISAAPTSWLLTPRAACVVRLYASMYPDEVVGMVLLDSTHEDLWLRFQEALTPAQWAEFEALTVINQKLLDAYPETERWFTAPLADDATAWSGTPVESERSAPPNAARRSGPRHRLLPRRLRGWPSDKMEGIMTALQEDLAERRPQRALRHRCSSRAGTIFTRTAAGAGHRGDPGGGRGGAQPKHLGPSTVIPVPWNSGPPKTAFSCLPPVPRADLAGRLRSRVRWYGNDASRHRATHSARPTPLFSSSTCSDSVKALRRSATSLQAMRSDLGNMPPPARRLPGPFCADRPDWRGGRELLMARWGIRPPFDLKGKNRDPSVTNIRNVASPHGVAGFELENRCVVPSSSFSDNGVLPDGMRSPVWLARNR